MRAVVRRQHSAGFTLVELLVSTVILSLALIALSQLYMASLWTHKRATMQSKATQIAQQKLEQLQYLGVSSYDQITRVATDTDQQVTADLQGMFLSTGGFTYTVPHKNDSIFTRPNAQCGVKFATTGAEDNITGTIVITRDPFNHNRPEDDSLARAVVTVSWVGRRGKTQSITLTTYLAKKPEVS